MGRTTAASLGILSLFLLLLPLTLPKPGMPPVLKADEPAYYLMALSMARDLDLKVEPRDLERLFEEFPYVAANNLVMLSDDGWQTLYFGKPVAMPLLAAPFARFLGANGMLLFNMVLFLGMIWMATLYLATFNRDAPAALFACGFFLLSNAFAYVFWLQPEMLNMFAVMACLFFGLGPFPRRPPWRVGRWLWSAGGAAMVSGGVLALGVYSKPMLAAFGLPVLAAYLGQSRWREMARWLAGAALVMGLLAGLSWMLVGEPIAYLGASRAGLTVREPGVMPEIPEILTAPVEATADEEDTGPWGSWSWIFRLPVSTPREVLEDLRFFLLGRHTGLVLYQPFAVLACLLFLLHAARSGVRWLVLGSIGAVGLFLILFIPFNWHGGGGFVGNRYFVNAYPAFLFLVTRIRPLAALPLTFLAAGLTVGILLLTPIGPVVPSPTLQFHVRNHAFASFPLEHGLREIPGYDGRVMEGVWIRGRFDQVRGIEHQLWIGGGKVELWLHSSEPLDRLVFEVSSRLPDNRVELRVGDRRARVVAGEEPQRVVLESIAPSLVRGERQMTDFGQLVTVYAYRLLLDVEKAELPIWRTDGDLFFLRGVILGFLGSDEEVATEVSAAVD